MLPWTSSTTQQVMHRLPQAFRLRQLHPPLRHLIRRPQSRAQSQVFHTVNGQPIRYQAVRIKGRRFTLRKLATIGIYTGAVYAYLHFLVRYMGISVEIEMLEHGEEEDDDADQHQDGMEAQGGTGAEFQDDGLPYYADETSTFIPLTWATKLPRAFYKGSDPEWQEFRSIAQDRERQKRIQTQLVDIVYQQCLKHPILAHHLGKDAKVGKYWLDLSFPDGPPQEFVRSGIEVGEGFVAWSQQRVTPETQWRLARALWPRAMAESLWATGRVLGGLQWRRLREAIGWDGADGGGGGGVEAEKYRHAFETIAKHQQAQQQQGKRVGGAQTEPGSPPAGSGVASGGSPSGPSTSTPSQPPRPAPSSAGSDPKRPWNLPLPFPSSLSNSLSTTNPTTSTTTNSNSNPSQPPQSTNLPIAVHVFQSTLSKSWNPKQTEPPRGTFVVQGLVEIHGARARLIMDVRSCFDPKQGRYVLVNAAVRGLKRVQQAPRGGA